MLEPGMGGAAEYVVVLGALSLGAVAGVVSFFGCTGRDLDAVSKGKLMACGLCGGFVGVMTGVAFGLGGMAFIAAGAAEAAGVPYIAWAGKGAALKALIGQLASIAVGVICTGAGLMMS
jgi:uncharacterized membrane protein YbhN (UPF0104 family)